MKSWVSSHKLGTCTVIFNQWKVTKWNINGTIRQYCYLCTFHPINWKKCWISNIVTSWLLHSICKFTAAVSRTASIQQQCLEQQVYSSSVRTASIQQQCQDSKYTAAVSRTYVYLLILQQISFFALTAVFSRNVPAWQFTFVAAKILTGNEL